MADQEEKFPPRPPHRPCGPWPSVFPYDKDYPGDRPPHRPPHWPHWNDTEPVMGAYPWEHCCDGDEDPCLCITSGEVDIWNQTYSAVSGHSADWDRAVDDSWKNSADNWQSTYETVSANSAFWDSAYKIASAWDSGANESIYNIISATSAFLKTYSAEPYFHANSAYFQGNGSPEHPLDLSEIYKMYWGWIDEAMNDLYSGGKWGDSGSRRWMSDSGYNNLMEWIKYHDELMWKPGPETNPPDPTAEPRSNYGGIFYQLEKLWHVIGDPDSPYRIVLDNSGHWDSTYQTVLANSGRWESDYETTNANSGNWSSVYESMKENSGHYDEAYDGIKDVQQTSGDWDSVYSTVSSYSASWAGISLEDSGHWTDTYHTVEDHSAYWEAASSAVSANSAAWARGDDSWKNSATNWQSTYQTVKADSGDWDSTFKTVGSSSGDWESTYDTVYENSGNWNGAYEAVETNSGSWNDTCATVTENSASWAKGSHETWEFAPDMTIENYAQYNEPDKIYFNFRD